MSDINHHEYLSTTQARAQVDYSPAAIADHCGRAERNGRDFKCNCPICGRHSLSVTYGHKLAILIKCWHCEACAINDGYTEQREYLIERGLLEPNHRDAQKFSHEKYEKWNAARRAEAARIWNSRFVEPLSGNDCASQYLRARGLNDL